MADNNNNNQEIMKNNETPKKHSYFWWKINKDLLDFRYNTQEEIDKLNEKMTITNDLDEIIKQTSNLPENKDTDEQENYDDNKYNTDTEERKPEDEVIEWEIVEDNNITENLEQNKSYETNNTENENKNEEVESWNTAKFFDPFELGFDDDENEDEKNDEKWKDKKDSKWNEKIIDPFEINEPEEFVIESEKTSEPEDHTEVQKPIIEDEKDLDDEIIDPFELIESEQPTPEEKPTETKEPIVEDKEISDIEEPTETKDITDKTEKDLDDEIIDPFELIESEQPTPEEKPTETQKPIVEDKETSDIEQPTETKEHIIEDKDASNVEQPTETKEPIIEDKETSDIEEPTETKEPIVEDKETSDIEEPTNIEQSVETKEITEEDEPNNVQEYGITSENREEKESEREKIKKGKKYSTNWKELTNEEIQLEQWQDMPNVEDVEEYQPTAEEIFEQEPEFFWDDELSQQFMQLVQNVREIFKIERKTKEDIDYFKIIWWKTEDSMTEYQFYLIEEENEPIDLYIKKVETNKVNEEENEHLVQFSYNKEKMLNIFVDEIILYENINNYDKDTQEYNDTKVILEKFIFLTKTYYDELNEEINKQREKKQKKRQLQQIFKGF